VSVRPKVPAHLALAVNQECRGHCRVLVQGRGIIVDQAGSPNERLIRVREDNQSRVLCLRHRGGLEVFDRGGDDLNVAPGKLVELRFELTQLDQADQSVAAPKEDK
jgi:hypothetical protein